MAKRIWFSGATDITGNALAQALNITGVREKPTTSDGDITICWGVKTDRDVTLRGKVLNHPNTIRKNRNKLEALKMMSADRALTSAIAPFVAANEITTAINSRRMSYPIVGRKTHHQGGKGFWLCLNDSHVQSAIADGAEYFQKFINIATEYRLHIFDGEVIYAVKKVENASEESWAAYRRDKINDYAQKNNVQMDANTVNYALKVLFKEAQLPNRLIRSNHLGWKFTSVAVNTLPAALKAAAIKAVQVIGLDFAAVDCAIGTDNAPYIIECNSGPGLEGTTLTKYTEALSRKLAEFERPAARASAAQVEVAPNHTAHRVSAAGANGNAAVGAEQTRLMMNAVRTPEEASRLLDFLMGRG